MKTSNKILLGALITAMLLVFSLHATIYIKFKKGNYTLNKLHPMVNESPLAKEYTVVNDGSSKEIHRLDTIKYVLLENVAVQLFNSDSQRLELVQEDDEQIEKVEFAQRGDSLIIFVREKVQKEIPSATIQLPVLLYLNKDITVHARDANISLQTEKDSTAAPSFYLDLDKGSMLNILNPPSNILVKYQNLNIDARDGSQILLDNASVRHAKILLKQSKLNIMNSEVDKLILKNDKASNVFISASNVSGEN